jgi:hypothetical protein
VKKIIEDLINDTNPERIGIYDKIWKQTLERWVGEGYPVNDAGLPVPPDEHFSFDMFQGGSGPVSEPHPGVREILQETDEWEIYRNGAGAALKWWKKQAGTPEHIDFLMTTREIWEKEYREYLLELNRERLGFDACRGGLEKGKTQSRFCYWGHAFVWELLRQSLGDIAMYENLILDQDWIKDFCRVYTDFYIKHMSLLIKEAGKPDAIRWCEDLAYKERLFCSVDHLRELIFPHYYRYAEFYKNQNIPIIFHSCGYVTPALPLLKELGIDMLDPMERKAGCDPYEIARNYGKDFVLRGGFNVSILEEGDKDTIKKEVRLHIEKMKSAGARYIFSTDHSVTTNVTYDNYRYCQETVRRFSSY